MTIVIQQDTILAGPDFAAAVTGPYRYHGEMNIGTCDADAKRYKFKTTVGIKETRTAINVEAAKDGKAVCTHWTQAL